MGSNVYFFFREKAEEQRDIFPKIYSRVGRLCKVTSHQRFCLLREIDVFFQNDMDTGTIMANTWTTFRKARITCLSGNNDSLFVFNDISM